MKRYGSFITADAALDEATNLLSYALFGHDRSVATVAAWRVDVRNLLLETRPEALPPKGDASDLLDAARRVDKLISAVGLPIKHDHPCFKDAHATLERFRTAIAKAESENE